MNQLQEAVNLLPGHYLALAVSTLNRKQCSSIQISYKKRFKSDSKMLSSTFLIKETVKKRSRVKARSSENVSSEQMKIVIINNM